MSKTQDEANPLNAVHDTKTGPAVIGRNRNRNNVPVHPTVTTGKQSKNRIFATIRASRARLGPADDVAGSDVPPALDEVWPIGPLDEIRTRRGFGG